MYLKSGSLLPQAWVSNSKENKFLLTIVDMLALQYTSPNNSARVTDTEMQSGLD